MILLDTNVISELMKTEPHGHVLAWTDQQPDTDLYFAAISKAEVEWGIELLADGKRKRQLQEAAADVFALFEGRCLDYRYDVTPHYVAVAMESKRTGRPRCASAEGSWLRYQLCNFGTEVRIYSKRRGTA
ncbi:MAG: PIN domain-containing protein [Thiotrichales bacterium]